MFGGELCKIAGGVPIGAPGGAAVTDSPNARFVAGGMSTTSLALPRARAKKAAATTPEVV